MLEADLQEAAENRQRIASGYATRWWTWYESVVRNTPYSHPLPAYIPIGNLPQAGGHYRGGGDET